MDTIWVFIEFRSGMTKALVVHGGRLIYGGDTQMDTYSQVAAWLALITSGGALWFSMKADRRAAAAEQRAIAAEEREIEQHRRQEVFFEAEFVQESSGEYEFRIVNTGTKSARFPKVAPESVSRFAVPIDMWGSADPHVPLRFRYEKPRYGQLEMIRLTWTGPGTGEQNLAIPPHREDV